MGDKKKILILGTGYGGVHAAKLLNKKFKKNNDVEITIIGKDPYHTLMTELHEVVGGRIEEDGVKVYLNKIFGASKVKVITDTISNIDFKNQKLLSNDNKNNYSYDYLILGSGSEPAFFGIQGVKENSFTIGSLSDSIKLREHIKEMFIKASTEKDEERRRELLTFVVAGAGFTGIETVGELVEWKKKLSKYYHVDEKEVSLVVVEAMSKILPMLNDNLIQKSERYLSKKTVKIYKDSPIVEATDKYITLKSGEKIHTNTLIWTCGVQATSFAASLGLTVGPKGRIKVNEYMQSVDYNNVYVVGDTSVCEEDSKGCKLNMPLIVEAALQTAETAVESISSEIVKGDRKPFNPKYHGLMVSIGSRYGVADIMGMSLSGFFAIAMKHLVNMHYLFGVAGFNAIWEYLQHEFFHIKEKRSILGGHIAAKTHNFWLLPLRVYVGVLWLLEGIKKVQDGWLEPSNIFIVANNAAEKVAGAAQAVSGASQKVAETVASASQSVTGAAQAAAQNYPTPLLSQPPEIYKWFMDTFVSKMPFVFQASVVIAEICIGLALIAGLFTFLSSLGSIFLSVNFILSAMAGKEILWYIFAAIALMGGSGRAFGLDYYVMPFLKKWWNKTKLARKTYLYMD